MRVPGGEDGSEMMPVKPPQSLCVSATSRHVCDDTQRLGCHTLSHSLFARISTLVAQINDHPVRL